MLLTLALLLSLFVSSCSNMHKSQQKNNGVDQTLKVPINYSLFSDIEKKQLNEEDIFFLSPEQQEELRLNFDEKIASGFAPHKALSEVLAERLANFTYYGETYDATTAIKLYKGNCMSLAILTTAYAKVLGLKISYRKVNTLPVFAKKDDIILSSSHVQTLIYDPNFIADKNIFYLSTPAVVIDYFPSTSHHTGKKISLETFLSMYYKNIAADALTDKNLNKSFLYANKAYQLDIENIETINLLAVIHRRSSDLQTAEAIYKAGLDKGQTNISLLSNYIMLLKSQQRMDEVNTLQDQLNQLDDPNPYQWLGEAYTAQNIGNVKQAEVYFKKALAKAPYLNQAYMGLYKIYVKQNKLKKAQTMLVKALEWTYELDERKLYKFKLYNIEHNIAANH
jgi:tetratricopeptide (TPR) repeat protein